MEQRFCNDVPEFSVFLLTVFLFSALEYDSCQRFVSLYEKLISCCTVNSFGQFCSHASKAIHPYGKEALVR